MSHFEFLTSPLHAPPAYAAVVERVRRALALGILVPGDRLPPERVLAEGMGVSRVTVREALRILQGEGLLVTRRGSGGTTVAATLDASALQGDTLEHHLAEVFELRMAVETMAARLAAERQDDGDVDQLARCQADLAASSNVYSFRRADSDFHLTVARMAGNGLLRQAIEDARAAALSSLDRREFTVLRESSLRGHEMVLDAIKRADGNAAAHAMAEHLIEAREEVTKILHGT